MIQREDELIKQLAQLSLDKEAKDRENKDLMKQLEAMKARLEAREDDKCVQDEIERKLREKEERRRNVEKLRKERLKKQKEDKDEEMKIQKLNEGIRQAELVRIIVNYLYLSLHRFRLENRCGTIESCFVSNDLAALTFVNFKNLFD